MSINDKRKQTRKKRLSPEQRTIDIAMSDYEQHFDQLQDLGIKGKEFNQCMARFIDTFWSE